MRTIRRIGFAVAVFSTACTLAAAAAPVLLRYHQKPGDKAVYVMTGTAKSKLAAQGRTQTATETARVQCGIEYAKGAIPGQMQITGRVLQGTVTAASGGESQTLPLPTSTALYVVTVLGELKHQERTSGRPASFPFSGVEFGPMDAIAPAPLPRKAVSIGESWSGSQDIPPLEGASGKLITKSKLMGETTYAGRRCLQIRTDFHGTARADIPYGGTRNRVQANVVITGTTRWLLDPAEGLPLKSDIRGTQELTVGAGGASAARVTSAVDQRVQLVEWNGHRVEAR